MIKKDNLSTYVNMLNELMKLSKCDKRSVGCFIIKNNTIISSGINGTPTGYHNICEERILECSCGNEIKVKEAYDDNTIHIVCEGCTKEYRFNVFNIDSITKLKSLDTVIHAEENAILKAVKNNIPLDGSEMIVTTMPCLGCAKKIHAVGIRKVYYKDEYKNTDGVNLLKDLGIDVIKIEG